ncbi:MAG: hypothetical protein EBX41_04620 [Chitinophagia bacterium]|nr:hypothetical protein [Chitinophagia bacterium]
MIYVAIDDSQDSAQKMVDFITTLPFATVYRDWHPDTVVAFEEIANKQVIEAQSVNDLMNKLKS